MEWKNILHLLAVYLWTLAPVLCLDNDTPIDSAEVKAPELGPMNNSLQPECPFPEENYDMCTYYENLSQVVTPWNEDPMFFPTVIVYGVAFLLGVTGNLLVMFALLGDRKSRNVTSSFLVSLALADLVFLMVCIPCEVGVKMSVTFTGGLLLCKLYGFAEMLSAAASVLNLTAVSVER